MSPAKQKYLSLLSKLSDIPIFFQPWWLDAVVENNEWDAVFIEEEESLKACFVYVLKKKGPFTSVGMPGLTPFLGFWIENNFKFEHTKELLAGLPKHDKFYMKMHHKTGIQLEKSGYSRDTLHTYVLSNIKDQDALYAGFKSNLRGTIRKASSKIRIVETEDVNQLYALCQMSFKRQSKEVDFSLDLVKKIWSAVKARNCGAILHAMDDEGKVHAATLIVWDESCAYYLLNGGNPKLRSSGANSLLMWKSIEYASQFTNKFDFEGSMIPGVEEFIKAFGAEKKQYSLFTKTNSKIIAVAEGLKKALGK